MTRFVTGLVALAVLCGCTPAAETAQPATRTVTVRVPATVVETTVITETVTPESEDDANDPLSKMNSMRSELNAAGVPYPDDSDARELAYDVCVDLVRSDNEDTAQAKIQQQYRENGWSREQARVYIAAVLRHLCI